MSRASGASFAQFFPSAPRAAKDKAKEREKSKSQSLESPSIRPIADTKFSFSNSRVDVALSSRHGGHSNLYANDTLAPQAEDNELIQGDLLNGVGSASSHTSTLSSGFSAPAQQCNITTTGGSGNISSLTPLTNIDSSPSRTTSPRQSKASIPSTIPALLYTEKAAVQDDAPPAQPAMAGQNPPNPRVFARDPSRVIQGIKCAYDPLLDRKNSSTELKKKRPIYKEFGLVRITLYKLRGASSCLCECLANGFAGR